MKMELLYQKFKESTGVCTDSRKISLDVIFFALKGDNFNGNIFAAKALDLGAKFVVIDEEEYRIDDRCILVDNVLDTLQKLANYHRNQIPATIISLTGSNGKTTTKELINCVLQKKYITKATLGNLNNHIGVPLTLLSFNENTQIGIVEMGANHQKEIELLCEIAEPDFGYITNFGKAHLEGFGGIEGVIKGKCEMYTYLRKANKKVFINSEDPIQVDKSMGIERITFGESKDDFLKIDSVSANPMVSINFENTTIHSNLIGLYNASNISLAVAIGKYFEVSNEDIKLAIEAFVPSNNRSQIIYKNSHEIILDAYNANPSSMSVALINFFQLNNVTKIAILGDMFELGNDSIDEHHKIIEQCIDQPEIQFYFIGKDFFENKIDKSNIKFFEDFESFKNSFKIMGQNTLILIKGSRGMSLERVLDFIN